MGQLTIDRWLFRWALARFNTQGMPMASMVHDQPLEHIRPAIVVSVPKGTELDYLLVLGAHLLEAGMSWVDIQELGAAVEVVQPGIPGLVLRPA